MNHRDIPGSVFPARPEGEEDVCWLPAGAWEEVLALLGSTYACSHCSSLEGVSQGIMSAYPGTVCPAAQSMVP